MSYAREGDAHMGPIPLPGNQGTLTSADRNKIWHETGVSATVRWRQQWQARCLSLAGPASKLTRAKEMADAAILANGVEGGRAQAREDALQNQVNQMAATTTTMWQQLQLLTGRVAQLEGQLLAACNAMQKRRKQEPAPGMAKANRRKREATPSSSASSSTDDNKDAKPSTSKEKPEASLRKPERVKEEPQRDEQECSPTEITDAGAALCSSPSGEAPTLIPVDDEAKSEDEKVPNALPLKSVKEEPCLDD